MFSRACIFNKQPPDGRQCRDYVLKMAYFVIAKLIKTKIKISSYLMNNSFLLKTSKVYIGFKIKSQV